MALETDLKNGKKPATDSTSTRPLKDHHNDTTLSDNLPSNFELLITKTISSYNEYINEQSFKNQGKKVTQNRDENNKENTNMSSNDSNDFTSHFERFNANFNKLLVNIRQAKQTEYFQFMNIFRCTNSTINELYEFASKLLNSHSWHVDSDETDKKTIAIKRTIEMLHILVTSNVKNFRNKFASYSPN